jgi:hypothetical protein
MPLCKIVPQMEFESDGLNGIKPACHSFLAQVVFLSEEMTLREIVLALEDFSFQHGRHAVTFDQGVRRYLLAALKAHLPRRREVSA